MAYHGVKFTTKFIGISFSTDSRVDELVYWSNEFARHQLAPTHPEGSYGNLSFRLSEKEMLITATSLDLGARLSCEDFVIVHDCDFDAFEIVATGKKAPSSESPVHVALYRARPDIRAIFHGHNEYINEHGRECGVEETSMEQPYGSMELVHEVLKLSGHTFFNMKNHGFISMGKTMNEAGRQALDVIQELSLKG